MLKRMPQLTWSQVGIWHEDDSSFNALSNLQPNFCYTTLFPHRVQQETQYCYRSSISVMLVQKISGTDVVQKTKLHITLEKSH